MIEIIISAWTSNFVNIYTSNVQTQIKMIVDLYSIFYNFSNNNSLETL